MKTLIQSAGKANLVNPPFDRLQFTPRRQPGYRHWSIGNQGSSHPGSYDPNCIPNAIQHTFSINHRTTFKFPDDFYQPKCDY